MCTAYDKRDSRIQYFRFNRVLFIFFSNRRTRRVKGSIYLFKYLIIKFDYCSEANRDNEQR